MPDINFDPDVLNESGLGAHEPGDVVYLPIKATILGKDGEVTGLKIEGLGPISDASATEYVDAYGENDNNDMLEKATDENLGPDDEAPEGEGEAELSPAPEKEAVPPVTDDNEIPADESAPVDEEKILGYKPSKKKKVKMPKASDLFE